MPGGSFNEEFLYLTTVGRKTAQAREIEIWFVERAGRLYVLAEHGYKANWVKNILENSTVTIRLGALRREATGRVLDPNQEGELCAEVRQLAREKYGWGDGLPVELRLSRTSAN